MVGKGRRQDTLLFYVATLYNSETTRSFLAQRGRDLLHALPSAAAYVTLKWEVSNVPESYSQSALRHLADADRLATGGHLDGAGYLIGFVAECAIKAAINATRPAAGAPHVHLPKLVEGAKKALQGRRKHAIFKLLEQAEFMQGWYIDVRYASDGAVDVNHYERWRRDASRALAAANLRRRRS